jgi:hypothetical protein
MSTLANWVYILRRRDKEDDDRNTNPGAQNRDAPDVYVPYNSARYWLKGGGLGSGPPESPGWAELLLVLSGLSGMAFISLLIVAAVKGLLTIPAWRHILLAIWMLISYAARYAIIAFGVIVGVFTLCSVVVGFWAAAKRRRERQLLDRIWQERLRKVNVEAKRLRDQDVNVAYIIDHLMDGVDATNAGSGILQARIESIRGRIVFDEETIRKLDSYAQKTLILSTKRLLWSLIEDMTRIRVMDQERRRYQVDGQRDRVT